MIDDYKQAIPGVGAKRRIVYVGHPYGGEKANLERAKRWLGWLLAAYPAIDFTADWIVWCEVLPESAENRARGVAFDREMVARCDAFWAVGGRWSSGMIQELEAAIAVHKPYVDLTELGEEPPTAKDGWWNADGGRFGLW